MPAAIAVPLIVGAASSAATVYAAHRQGSAADKATDAETASNREAQAFLEREAQHARDDEAARLARMQKANTYLEGAGREQGSLYDQALSALNPYLSLGAGAAGALGHGLGLAPSGGGPLSAMGSQAARSVGNYAVPAPVGPHAPAPVTYAPNAQTFGPMTDALNPTLNPFPPPGRGTPLGGQVGSAVSRTSSYGGESWNPFHNGGGAPPTAAPLVAMQAPDGSIKEVPAAEVPHWQQQGAKIVGQ